MQADHLKLILRTDAGLAVEEPTFEVQNITAHRTEKNGKMRYFVVWKDRNVEPGWEPVENFNDINVIWKYWKKVLPTRKSKKSE